MQHRTPALAGLPTALLILATVDLATATVPADLCTGNPCVVTKALTIAAGSDLEFGSVALHLAPTAALTVGSGPERNLVLRAGAIILQPGAAILGGGDDASVTLRATRGPIDVQRTGSTAARIDVGANQAGSITLDATGDVTIAGTVEARGIGRDAEAGAIDVSTGGTLSVTGSVLASATTSGAAGGTVSLDAASSLSVAGTLSVAGAGFGGGDLTLSSSSGSITLAGTADLGGGGPDGSGGSFEASAPGGDIVLNGTLTGTGATGAQEACGDGASLLVDAGRDVALGGTVDVSAGTHCLGGEVVVAAAGEIRQPTGAVLRARGPGAFGGGGRLEIAAGTRAVLRDVDLGSPGAGGTLDAVAPQSIDVRGALDASASGASGVGGTITLQSCAVNVARTGSLDTRGPLPRDGFAGNTIRASGALTVAGTVRAGVQNRFVHKGAPPVVSGTVTPAAIVLLDATLPDCPRTPACGDGVLDAGEACDDGNTVSCDGCSASCTRSDATCGDGVPECGEPCDDGNLTDGDGCESDCTRTPPSGVRVRGVPLAESGCLAQWALALPAPALDPDSGLPSQRQTCQDGDPGCDADQRIDGVCTVAASVCLKVPDPALPSCAPHSVKLLGLDRPKPDEGADAVDRANAEELLAGLGALGVKLRSGTTLVRSGAPVLADDTCTGPLLLRVPHAAGTADERTFRISARAHGAPQMRRNGLTIVCESAAATCGDGVQQSGEECDDGNTDSCDGCSAACANEGCGNGVVECTEECDEGAANGRDDGACTATCERRTPELRIPGGGARREDCTFEWSALGAGDAFARDRNGLPRGTFLCADGDPSCDLDPRAGTCRVRIWGCFGAADERLGCGARAASGVQVRSPAANVRRAPEVAARAAMLGAFAGMTFPSGPGERCTAPIELDVPVRQAWLDLKVEIPIAGAPAADRDALRIRCR